MKNIKKDNMKAVVLFSGGLDSTTVLAIAQNLGYEVYALSFDYGQRHQIELEIAKKIAQNMKVKEHKIAKIDLRIFGGSALTDEIEVPKNSFDHTSIPVTYVPARNIIFLSYALAYAENLGAKDIFLGVNAVDYSNYPDCRPEFISAFTKAANLATAASAGQNEHFKIHAPLIELSKAQIIAQGLKLGVDYSQTHSCYDPKIVADKVISCGKCDSCTLRLKGFEDAGEKDLLNYS